MSATSAPTRLPVQVVFRVSPLPKTGKVVGGKLAERILGDIEQFNTQQVMAILPYTPLAPGLKAKGMVAMLSSGGSRLIVDYTPFIKNTEPATPDQYASLLDEMQTKGHYEVQIIEATQINHLLRRAERAKGDIAPEEAAEVEMVVEDIRIEVDIINDDVEAGTGVGSDSFSEEWA